MPCAGDADSRGPAKRARHGSEQRDQEEASEPLLPDGRQKQMFERQKQTRSDRVKLARILGQDSTPAEDASAPEIPQAPVTASPHAEGGGDDAMPPQRSPKDGVSVPRGDGVVGNQGRFCASQGDGSFERWLHATGAWWDEELVEIRSPWRAYSPDNNVPSFLRDGWGLMSRDKKIKKGTVICRVPKEASFRGDEGTSCTEEQDSQLHLAIRLLREKRKGSASDVWPKIATLPSRVPVCWAWAQNEREWLKGSELEFVVRRKLERLDAEFRESIEPLGEGFSKAEYVDACASIISHANPWWGVSSVSFVDMGNHDDDPHVEFRQQGDHVVGTVVKTIPRKSEIYQSYGELGSADLLYRYGFTREGPGAEVYIYMLSSPATLPCMHAHTQERAHDQEMPARKLAVEVNSEEQLYFLLNVTNFVNQYMM